MCTRTAITPPRRWLDIGFGNGSLLFTAQKFGFEPVGIDLRKDTAAALQAFGIEAHAIDLADFNPPVAFDVVSMCDVLEHMPFPKDGLRQVHRLLKAEGALFLSMPNSDSVLWRSLDAQNANPYLGGAGALSQLQPATALQPAGGKRFRAAALRRERPLSGLHGRGRAKKKMT